MMFELAREKKPAVIFLDEIDSLARCGSSISVRGAHMFYCGFEFRVQCFVTIWFAVHAAIVKARARGESRQRF